MKLIWDILSSYIAEHQLLFLGNVLLSLTFPLDDIIIPYLTGKIVSLVEGKKNWKSSLVFLVLTIIVLQVIFTVILQYDSYLIPSIENFIRTEMIINIANKPDLGGLKTGEILSRIAKIPSVMSQTITQIKNVLIPYIISFIVTSVIIISYNKTIGITFALIGTLVLMLYFVSPTICAQVSSDREQALALVDDRIEDLIRNVHTIKTSATLAEEVVQLEEIENRYAKLYRNTIWCTNKMKIYIVGLITILLLITSHYTYTSISNKTLTIGAFITIFMIITQWCLSLAWISNKIGTFVLDLSILNAYEKSFGKNNQSKEEVCEETTSSNEGLYITSLNYTLKNRKNSILNNINLHIPLNTRLLIRGNIGQGKSTFLKCIAGVLEPTGGTICYNGKTVVPGMVGYAQQTPVLFNRTLYENIIYGTPDNPKLRTQVENLLKELELFEVFAQLDNGLDTIVGKNGNILSGGQKQIVQLFRILLQDPEIIILDEVTSSLDSETKQKVLSIIERLIADKIVIMTSHDADFHIANSFELTMNEGEFVI